MPIADANGVKIAYDMRGPDGGPSILLIMGLGTQMTAWSDPFCDALAAGGYQVVRFDNRDVGVWLTRSADLSSTIVAQLTTAPARPRDLAGASAPQLSVHT